MTIAFDDFRLDEFGAWTHVCSNHYKKLSKIVELESIASDKPTGEGICGVVGCLEESTNYVNTVIDNVMK